MSRIADGLVSRVTLAALLSLAAGSVQAATWVTTAMPWVLMPGGAPLGEFPQTVPISAVPYEYAARSERVDLFGKAQPVILRITVQTQSGSVGMSLIDPGGAEQISKEAPLKPTGADTEVYFRIRPGTPPAMIFLRNYAAQGQAGAIVIKNVEFTREGDLTNDELTAIVQKGLY